MENDRTTESPLIPVRVWDLPTRFFHWLLLALVISSFVTGKIGGNLMPYHVWSGEAILTLLLFRLVWGFIGSAPSRFGAFLSGPATVMRYIPTLLRRDTPHYIGHNPLGGWSVMAMLMALFIQAGTGLFADDKIATTGPLYKWVSSAASDRLTSIHRLNQKVIIVLVALHVAAVLFHLIYKRENLITPMITGKKLWRRDLAEDISRQPLWRAAMVAALAAGAVYLVVR
jgi:cytochrome b